MELIEIKKKVYDKCVEKQKEILENAKAAMDDAQKAANEYGPPRDRYDSFRAQLLRKRDLHAEQYEKAIKEMDFLLNIKPENQNNEARLFRLSLTARSQFNQRVALFSHLIYDELKR